MALRQALTAAQPSGQRPQGGQQRGVDLVVRHITPLCSTTDSCPSV